MARIFFSHSHDDFRLASNLQELLDWASGGGFQFARSSEDGAIKAGENWYEWIDDQVLSCDVAVVLLTPSSFRGNWVMWEAGAVTGVQRARAEAQDQGGEPTSEPMRGDSPPAAARRVRVIGFDLGSADLGPFGKQQTVDGLDWKKLVAFIEELLEDFRPELDGRKINQTYRELDDRAQTFVRQAREDLRFTPIAATEGLVQEWLGRIDASLEKEDSSWISSARRWINVAFLGAGNADASTPIDFRIHSRLARGHERARNWQRAIEELKLASQLSPNDLPILVRLGRALLSADRQDEVGAHLESLQRMDERVFELDREAVTLRCRFLAASDNWVAVDEHLSGVADDLVANDEYLATWRALAAMRVHGPEESRKWFVQLEQLTQGMDGFWADASRLNALFGLGKTEEAGAVLQRMGLPSHPANEVESASRYYDEILQKFGFSYDWRSAAGLQPAS